MQLCFITTDYKKNKKIQHVLPNPQAFTIPPLIVYSLPRIVCSGEVQNIVGKVVDHFITKGLIFGHSNLEPLSPQYVPTSNMDNKVKCTLKKIPAFPPTPHTRTVSVDLPKSQWIEHVKFKDVSMGQPSVLCFILFRIQFYISALCALVEIYDILCNCDPLWWILQMMIGSLSTSHFSQTASGILFIWFISPTN